MRKMVLALFIGLIVQLVFISKYGLESLEIYAFHIPMLVMLGMSMFLLRARFQIRSSESKWESILNSYDGLLVAIEGMQAEKSPCLPYALRIQRIVYVYQYLIGWSLCYPFILTVIGLSRLKT